MYTTMEYTHSILPRAFYDRSPKIVARELLGTLLVRRWHDTFLIGKIVETEAYLPKDDPASHSYRGITKRNASMFKDAGHAYVYRMRQFCLLNVVTEGEGIPGAVLIRALEPCEGKEIMREFYGETNSETIACGPGKLCRALSITHALDGTLLTNHENELLIVGGTHAVPEPISTSGRIGISSAQELQLRFFLTGSMFVSHRTHKRRERP